MGTRQRSILILLLAAVIALASVPTAGGAAAATAAQIKAKQAEAAQARLAMAQMQSDLTAGMEQYSKTSNDLERTRDEISVNTVRLKALQASLVAEQQQLRGRASYMYRTGTGDLIDVLFGARSFNDFSSRLEALTEIADRDAELIRHVKSERAESERLRTGLKDREARQLALKDQAAARRSSVQSQLDKQQRYISSLSADVAQLVAQQERARAAAESAARVKTGSGTSGGGHSGGGGGGSSIGGGTDLVGATVEGRDGGYLVMSGEPRKYRATGVTVDGKASTYSNADNGTGTSSGRTFNDRELTCAHPSLAFGTRLAISRGGNRIIVVVTDRGPYTGGRVLDLTTRAGDLLGIDGVGTVHAEVVEPAN